MPDPNPDPKSNRDMSAILELLPMDIIESVIVSLIKVFGDQPAIEALLDLSGKVAESNFQTQNLLNQQSMLHNLTVAGTVKCLEMVLNIDPTSKNAPDRLRECLETIGVFKVNPTPPTQPETPQASSAGKAAT